MYHIMYLFSCRLSFKFFCFLHFFSFSTYLLLGTYFISYYYITCTILKLAFTYVRIITHKYCFPWKFTTDIENTQFAFCLLGRGEREGDKPLFSLLWYHWCMYFVKCKNQMCNKNVFLKLPNSTRKLMNHSSEFNTLPSVRVQT